MDTIKIQFPTDQCLCFLPCCWHCKSTGSYVRHKASGCSWKWHCCGCDRCL